MVNNDTDFVAQAHNFSEDMTILYNQFKFFASHVHIFLKIHANFIVDSLDQFTFSLIFIKKCSHSLLPLIDFFIFYKINFLFRLELKIIFQTIKTKTSK